jgi:aryl-alcohol dehydrogenase-like predicted oxidoreductase
MLPVLGFPSVALARMTDTEQAAANEAVRHAVEDLGIRYFDVAPEYGDGVAQERLGPALRPYRSQVFLAAKTMYRDAEGAAADLEATLTALQTDFLDLYQFHSISTEEDVRRIFSAGGAMETFVAAKEDGRIKAIGFSAHSEPMAIQMIETGLVDTCMFPINFAAYHFGGVGKGVLEAAVAAGVGVVALKACAKGRLKVRDGVDVTVPTEGMMRHVPEWKRLEMLNFPVVMNRRHPTCWYEPEEDPDELRRLFLWALSQKGVTAVLPPGSLDLLDCIASVVQGRTTVPEFDTEANLEHMRTRYEQVVPIFHNQNESGTKVST